MLYLYRIHNPVTGKEYIGVTCDPNRRWEEHKQGRGNIAVFRALKRHGDKIKFEIVCSGDDDEILELESEWVTEEYIRSGKSYNMAVGGGKPPTATKESSRKSAETRKMLIAQGKIKPPPRISSASQKKGGLTRKAMMVAGMIKKPPIISAESQRRAGETRRALHAAGLIDIGPGRDETVYRWEHKDGRVVELRRCDMEIQYGLPSGNITNMFKGRSKTCLGWRIVNEESSGD